MKHKILLLDGDGTQTLPIAESLYKLGACLHTFYSHKLSYGYATKYIKYKVDISVIKNETDFLLFTKTYLTDNKIDIIIPLGDSSAEFLSKNKTELSKHSKFIMPDYDVFIKAYNKGSLMSICEENNFPHPRTIKLNSTTINNIDNKIFPALIKPDITWGARGLTLVNNVEELKTHYPLIKAQYGECCLQEMIPQGGAQVEVQVLVGKNNELLFSSVIYKYRWYPEKAGSSCCNISVKNDEIVNICYELMKTLGWQGFADFDTIEDPRNGELKIMELNPRVPACVKTAVKSGIDWGNIIVDETLDNQHKNYTYTTGKKLRHIGFEFLWFFYSKNRFRTKPNWFNFFDKNLSFQDFSWKDPLPFFYGTFGNIKKQFSSEFRKSKSGARK